MLVVKNVFLMFFVLGSLLNFSSAFGFSRKEKTAFYKSKQSLFPSGEAAADDLNRSVINIVQSLAKTEDDYYQYGQQKISKTLLRPTFAKDLSLRKGYADIGRFLTLKETTLKKKAHSSASPIIFVPAHTLVIPLRYEKGFIEIIYLGKKGFIDISNCISKFDYAYAVYAKHPKTNLKQWHYVKSRLFDQIELYDQAHIQMSAVEGIFANDKMGIVTRNDDRLPLWSKVLVKFKTGTTDDENWRQSYLRGHGLIWWKPKLTKANTELNMHIDEILKQEVYSVSSHPRDPKKSIISITDGVFITSDGENWRILSSFKNFRGPVCYYNDNMIFVGSYRSIDHAKSFEPFINVNLVASAISSKLGYSPQSVKIRKIKSSGPSRISIDVDTGYKMLKLQSMIYNQNWEVIRN